MGQHQILPVFNLEQGAEFPTPASQESAKAMELLDICRRATLWFWFGFFFFKLGVFTQILSGFQSKWALCGHEAFSTHFHSLIGHPQPLSPADPKGFMVHYSI